MLPLCTSVTELAVVVDRVLDGGAHQALGAFARDRLDADARGGREADLLDAHFILQELDDLPGVVGFGHPFDAGVDVLGVLAENHHVGLARILQRRGDALEVTHRAYALVEVEFLAQRDVERADAAADGRGQRALDRYRVLLAGAERFLGQPDVRAIDARRLFASIDLHPGDLLLAAVGLGHGGIDHCLHHRRDVDTNAVALDEGDDRIVGRRLARDDFLTLAGYLDQGCAHECSVAVVRLGRLYYLPKLTHRIISLLSLATCQSRRPDFGVYVIHRC